MSQSIFCNDPKVEIKLHDMNQTVFVYPPNVFVGYANLVVISNKPIKNLVVSYEVEGGKDEKK